MKRKKLVLIGGGGHCKACIDVVESTNKYEIKGIIDRAEKVGQKVLGYPVIGSDDQISEIMHENIWFVITLGQIISAKLRSELFNRLLLMKANVATIISPFALISKYSKIGKGSIIMHDVIINPDVQIGENSTINTRATIEHDSIIGNNVHISTHAIINGNCTIGSNSFVGSNAVIFQGTTISENTIVGSGAVVTKNISNPGVYFGNPAKEKTNE